MSFSTIELIIQTFLMTSSSPARHCSFEHEDTHLPIFFKHSEPSTTIFLKKICRSFHLSVCCLSVSCPSAVVRHLKFLFIWIGQQSPLPSPLKNLFFDWTTVPSIMIFTQLHTHPLLFLVLKPSQRD